MNDNTPANGNDRMKDELLKSFHEQFAQNQNHHQSVFIQFISVVFIVLVGYAIVYTNTSSSANLFNTLKDIEQRLISYAVFHLFGSYAVAQIILTLLCTLTMNIGYGFRRDQKVNFTIRKYFISEKEYQSLFGTKSFNPINKKIYDFLPEFNSIFVNTIIVIQAFLFMSMIYAWTQFENFKLDFSEHPVTNSLTLVVLLLPLLLSFHLYRVYFNKYQEVVNETPQQVDDSK